MNTTNAAENEIDRALAEATQLENGLALQFTLASCGRTLEQPLRRMVALRQQALRLSCAELGDTHLASLAILDKLAEATAPLGDVADASQYSAAEALYVQALNSRALMLGHEHPDSVASAVRLWHFYVLAFRLPYLLVVALLLGGLTVCFALAFFLLSVPLTPAAEALLAVVVIFAPNLILRIVPRVLSRRVGLMLALSTRSVQTRAVARWQAAESCLCGCCCCCQRHR